jgi:UDPglucose 6-dehydrogenase
MSGARIAVVGCGHVGVVTAACFAELGHHVTGVDIDEARIEALATGHVPFIEPGLDELLARTKAAGRLRFSASYAEALAGAQFAFLCVNTPATASGAADLRHVRAAVASIAEVLSRSGECPVLVIKSTSPIGTEETIESIFARSFPAVSRPLIASNPEFLRQGCAVDDFFRPHRIVVGADSDDVAASVAALYKGIEAPLVQTDLRTAEMIKYVSNAFLATRVSFANEVARLCERLGTDADAVLRGAALDRRIGGDFLRPGIGYGGSCLPKDVAALCHTGDSVGVPMRVLASVQEANLLQRKHAVNCIRSVIGPLEGKTIAAWGATFKGGTDDLRESPAIDVLCLLQNEGAWVKVYDPSLRADSSVAFAQEICADALEAVDGADCLALLADWPQFADVSMAEVRRRMSGRLVYDGRNQLRRADVESAGLTYHGVGRAPGGGLVPATEAVR